MARMAEAGTPIKDVPVSITASLVESPTLLPDTVTSSRAMAQYPVGVTMLFQLIEPVKREESVAPIVIVPPGAMLLDEVLEALYASNPNAKTWEVKLPDWESACTRGTAPEDEIPCHPKPSRPEIVPVTIVWRISQAAKIWFGTVNPAMLTTSETKTPWAAPDP